MGLPKVWRLARQGYQCRKQHSGRGALVLPVEDDNRCGSARATPNEAGKLIREDEKPLPFRHGEMSPFWRMRPALHPHIELHPALTRCIFVTIPNQRHQADNHIFPVPLSHKLVGCLLSCSLANISSIKFLANS